MADVPLREAGQNPSLLRKRIFKSLFDFQHRKSPHCIAEDTSVVFAALKVT
jgi:hypothetical protein